MEPELRATESQAAFFVLSEGEASLLASLGRELSSTRSWWGGAIETGDRSVIGVDRLAQDRYRVTFRDVIGVVRLPHRQLQIAPKIPFDHFVYIASRSEVAPRVAAARVHVDQGAGFVEVLAQWCVGAAEELLRNGLRKDYREFRDELPEARGRLLGCETVMETMHGRAVAVCEFDELSDDAPLNRIVRGACQRIARLEAISEATRGRARRIAYRMDGVGPLEVTDTRTRVDRLSRAYARVIPLALLVLAGCGVSATAGHHVGTAFLVRTPELIEDGIRTLLSESLPGIGVTKRRIPLGETGLSMNPDLIFGDSFAVGDVKYRYLGPDWNRADLNQVVAFATSAHCSQCAVLGFVPAAGAPRPKAVPVGRVSATSFGWVASSGSDPKVSADHLSTQIGTWLSKHAA